jgi:flagellar protein FliO/FliZ
MMWWYILKLVIIIPVVAAMAYGSLWLWRRVQPGMAFTQRERMVKLVDAIPLGATGKLAVVDFAGKRLLLAVSRTGVTLVSESAAIEGMSDA